MAQQRTQPAPIGGRYALERRIARGGMAEVWLATDTFLHRDVAVKLLKPHLANDEDAAERFRREAKACAGITHPNIVAVYDCLDYQGQQAVVMQYVKGKSLRDILDRQKRLGPKLTVHIGVSIAAALAEAHARGIIHRDVKPGNILVTPQGRVLLADFGIAKEANPSERDLTSDNIMMGTAKYLSPEQVRGKPLDGRADLYSLGLVLYECLAGRVPFLGESDADTALARLQREPTDLGRLRPSLSPQLVKVIHKLIARHPDDRYATGTEARAALTAALTPNVDLTKPIVQPATTGEYVVDDEGELALTTVLPRTASSTPQRGLTRRDARRNGIRLLAVLASVGILAATVLSQLGGSDEVVAPQDTTPVEVIAPTVVSVQSVVSFDPNGDDGVENEALVPNLIDGNPETLWSTTCYANQYFGSKEFVGLLVTLTAPATGTLKIGMRNAPWAIEVFATNETPPADIAAWGPRVAKKFNTKRAGAVFSLTEPAQYVLIALREAGVSPACSSSNPYQSLLAGITFQQS